MGNEGKTPPPRPVRKARGLPEPSRAEVQAELESITAELAARYGGQVNEETVRRTVQATYERIAAQATVTQHLVPLTRNGVRNALEAGVKTAG
jgi:hypothetical protein